MDFEDGTGTFELRAVEVLSAGFPGTKGVESTIGRDDGTLFCAGGFGLVGAMEPPEVIALVGLGAGVGTGSTLANMARRAGSAI